MLWGKMTEKEYDKLLMEGHTHSEIYRSLRDNRSTPVREIKYKNEFDNVLLELNIELGHAIHGRYNFSYKTRSLIDDVKNNINRVLIRYEKESRRS